MIKRLISSALCLCMALGLCACASLFEKEYVLVEDYVPTAQQDSSQAEKLTVHDFEDLKQTIRDMVNSGQSGGSVIFDSAYAGDVAEDLSDACWQVRTQDALCAYCVVNIFYELNKIVAYYEAQINISYSSHSERVEDIAVLPYSTGLEGIIKEVLSEGRSRGAVLINHSSLSAQEMEDMVDEVYRKNPALAPCQPVTSVKMYSGTNQQRLYEINLIYGLNSAELAARQERLARFSPFADMETASLSEGRRALMAFDYIRSNISVDEQGQNNTIYSALIDKHADSEGIALAYVELCRQLGVECRIVYGQRNWRDHCWNIIRVGQDSYHVDAALAPETPAEDCFMRRDEQIWDICRWDMASYPACDGLISYTDVIRGRDLVPSELDKLSDDAAKAEPELEETEKNTLALDAESGEGDAALWLASARNAEKLYSVNDAESVAGRESVTETQRDKPADTEPESTLEATEDEARD